MGIHSLWPLALLVLVPGIILLYILKQEAKPHSFSSAMLWQEVYQNMEAVKPWEKLRKNLLMILQILTVLFLILALMGPWIRSKQETGQHAILVIDSSASMASEYKDGMSRLEAAKKAACEYLDTLSSGTYVSVINCSKDAVLAFSNSTDHADAAEKIKKIEQTYQPGTMNASLSLVQSCANQSEAAQIVFFTDTAFEMGNLDASVVSLYREQENCAMQSLSYAEKDGKLLVLAQIMNYGRENLVREINLYGRNESGKEELLDIQSVQIQAGEPASVYFELSAQRLISGLKSLRAELNESDALIEDNTGWCVLKASQEKKVLLLSESNLFLEKAFSSLDGVELYRTADETILENQQMKAQAYDLYIFDGMVPKTLPKQGSILFLNCPETEFFRQNGQKTGSMLHFADSEVTSYLDQKQFGVNESYTYPALSWAQPFLMCAEEMAGFYGAYDGRRIAALGFDLHSTDLGLRAEFPILISGLSDYLLENGLIEKNQYVIGENVLFHGSTKGDEIQIILPDGTAASLEAEEAAGSYFSPMQCGIYEVSQKQKEDTVRQLFAVSFPTDLESSVESAKTMQNASEQGDALMKGHGAHELRTIILIFVLLLLAAEWCVYRRQKPVRLRKRRDNRFFGELAIRLVVVMLIVLAMFGVQIRRNNDRTTTVFLVDLSDSVRNRKEEETQFIQEAIRSMPSKNQAGIVAFGADAQIEQFVSEKKLFTDFQSVVTESATNLEQAVQTALALFPEHDAKRLVLLTDGSENAGNVQNMVRHLSESQVEVKVLQYDTVTSNEVYVSRVNLPETIRKGDAFEVQVTVYASEPTNAVVSLYSGRTLQGQKTVQLHKGENQLVFADEGLEGGLKSYRVTVDAENDTVMVNNTYSAFTTIEAQPKLLLVEGKREESAAFKRVLDAGGYEYDVIAPNGVPVKLSDLNVYQSVILFDVHTDDLRNGFLDVLDSYVKDYAGSLIAIGGENSFALGAYQDTPLEQILPVRMELEGEKEIPPLSMVMVIDHSGSMSSPSTNNSSITCMDIAKQAAICGLESLRSIDNIGVIAFDDSYDWAVPIQKAADQGAVAERIASIKEGGGTSIYPAVAEAVSALKKQDTPLKHVIVLTDGQDGYNQYHPLIEEAKEAGITISTVAVGAEADNATLKKLAEDGGGRFYYSDASTALPRIFAQEVYLSAKSYLIQEEFTPVIVNSHEIIRTVLAEGCPSMLGYIASTPKSSATVILESEREDPILTVWQYGLGRSVAWNSDGTGKWTGNFSGWDSYPALWRNIIDWSMAGTQGGDDTLHVSQEASSAVICYQTDAYDAKTSVQAVVTGEDGTRKEIRLNASEPGVYKGEIPLAETGVYSISVRNKQGDEVIRAVNTATAMQYSKEYRYAEVGNGFEQFIKGVSAIRLESPADVFNTKLKGSQARKELTEPLLVIASILFLFDIVTRRMRLNWLRPIQEGISNAGKKLRKRKVQQRTSMATPVKQQADVEPVLEKTKQKAEKKEKMPKKEKKAKENTGAETIDTSALLKKKQDRNL